MKKLIIPALAAMIGLSSVAAQDIKPFKEGERAVFLGNSITDGGHYHSYIWLYYMTRFPNMPLTIYNGGIGGDTAYDMNKRLDNDIFSNDPTVLMVTFGMNDSGYMEHNGDNAAAFAEQKYQESIANYKNMEARFKQLPNTRIVMVGTSPYDENAKINAYCCHGKNATIERIVAYQMKSAEENGWEHVDWGSQMTAINTAHQATDSAFTLCGSDRIHPDNDGHMVMAYLFLKAQGFVGNKVAEVAVNAKSLKTTTQDNCTVTNLKKIGNTIRFDYLANALPYPCDTVAHGWEQHRPQANALKLVPFTEEMNQELLKVAGLKGDYKLLIDGEEIGIWSAADLANGINLATISKTPQYQQALTVMYLNERRWEIERKFRDYAWCQHGFFQQQGLLNANNRRAVEVMDQNLDNLWLKIKRDLYSEMMHEPVRNAMIGEMKLLVDKIYEVNTPVTRTVELRQQ